MKLSVSEINIINQANAIIDRKVKLGDAIIDTIQAMNLLRPRIALLEHEVFMVVFLDSQHKVIAIEEMFRGSIASASVYPREVAKAVLMHNAVAVIFAHNHPSGQTDPSLADKDITHALMNALSLFDVRVLDHFIFGAGPTVSMAERGML
ncbi:RadC family protein [Hahella sp. HN01]|uniref:JAB domain-containing protein n=1 Tax=Hahella sp. HN01 TaxID=2847262 RepID=UPI00353051BA